MFSKLFTVEPMDVDEYPMEVPMEIDEVDLSEPMEIDNPLGEPMEIDGQMWMSEHDLAVLGARWNEWTRELMAYRAMWF